MLLIRSALVTVSLALICTPAALAERRSATPPPGLPDPANSPTAGDQYHGRDARPSPGRRSATPPPGLPDPADSPTAGRDDSRERQFQRPRRFGGPVFGRPGERRTDAPFAGQADEAFDRRGPRYFGERRERRRGDYAEEDFAIDREGRR